MGHSCCAFGNDILLFGGWVGSYSNTTFRLNTIIIPSSSQRISLSSHLTRLNPAEQMSWERVKAEGKHPTPRTRHSAVMYENRMIIFGGYDGHTRNGIHVLDTGKNEHQPCVLLSILINTANKIATWRWEEIQTKGKAPVARSCHSATVVGNKMYIHGGDDASSRKWQSYSDLYALDLGIFNQLDLGKSTLTLYGIKHSVSHLLNM